MDWLTGLYDTTTTTSKKGGLVMLTTIEILSGTLGACRPLWLHYKSKNFEQPAYLLLNRDNMAFFRTDTSIGNLMFEEVHHGMALRWKVSSDLTVAELEVLARMVLPHINTIIAGSELCWNNENFGRSMSQEAKTASIAIAECLSQASNQDKDMCKHCGYCREFGNTEGY